MIGLPGRLITKVVKDVIWRIKHWLSHFLDKLYPFIWRNNGCSVAWN